MPSRSPERRKSATQEEKKRGRRLFGGVLSTLSQTPSQSSQHSRRQEIEQRQKERMQSQDSEAAQRRAQKLERLHSVRMAEQIVFEEQVVRPQPPPNPNCPAQASLNTGSAGLCSLMFPCS